MAKETTKTARVLSMLANGPSDGGASAFPAAPGGPASDGLPDDVEALADAVVAAKEAVTENLILFGQGLKKLKEKIGHGQWLDFLETRVMMHPRTAEYWMKAAEYSANSQALANLGRTKLFELLSLPSAEAAEAFVSEPHIVNGVEKTVEEMTTRELKQAIRERDEAREKLQSAKADMERWHTRAQSYDIEKMQMQQERDEARSKLADAEKRLDGAAVMERDNKELRQRVKGLEEIERAYNELKSRPVEVAVEPVPDENAIREAVEAAVKETEARAEEEKKAAMAASDKALTEANREKAEAEKRTVDAEKARAEAVAEVDRLKAEAEEKEKARKEADAQAAQKITLEDRGAANLLITQMGESLNRLAGLYQKAKAQGDTELEKAIREKIRRWIDGMEGLLK